jgi:hypothetical protein
LPEGTAMNHLSFVWAGPTPLAVELSKPIKQISIGLGVTISAPNFITLWRSDGTGLRMFSQMHDVAERIEVGVLNFEQVSAPQPDETIADVASAFQGEIAVSKLIIHESGTTAESGVILKAGNGEEIVIVAGVYPYSLAVLGVASMPHIFHPEYKIDRYIRVQ